MWCAETHVEVRNGHSGRVLPWDLAFLVLLGVWRRWWVVPLDVRAVGRPRGPVGELVADSFSRARSRLKVGVHGRACSRVLYGVVRHDWILWMCGRSLAALITGELLLYRAARMSPTRQGRARGAANSHDYCRTATIKNL